MKQPRFPSLFALILLGYSLAAGPLLVSIFTAITRVDRLARESRIDMMEVQENSTASRGLQERTTLLERSARQYLAVEEPSFKTLYQEHRQVALELLHRLATHSRSAQLVNAVDRVRNAELRVYQLIQSSNTARSKAGLEAALEELRNEVLVVVQEQNSISRSMASVLPDKAKTLQHALILQAALAIPVSAALAALYFFVIVLPLRQLKRSVKSLGQRTLGDPIVIRGAGDLEDLGQRLEWLRQRLIELEEQKSQFLRNVSHELKTPLTNIREGAELLCDGHADESREDVQKVARIVQSNSVRLQRMIEALLRYGADGDMTAGQPDQTVALDQLVLQSIERYESDTSVHSVTICHKLEPCMVLGNTKQLQIIIDNLLSNAVKHTPPGGRVELHVHLGENERVLDIKDSGPGIASADRERIFEWFYSGQIPPGSYVAGSGIGLAIAREYAEQHHGRIELVPSETGAHFRLTLPAER